MIAHECRALTQARAVRHPLADQTQHRRGCRAIGFTSPACRSCGKARLGCVLQPLLSGISSPRPRSALRLRGVQARPRRATGRPGATDAGAERPRHAGARGRIRAERDEAVTRCGGGDPSRGLNTCPTSRPLIRLSSFPEELGRRNRSRAVRTPSAGRRCRRCGRPPGSPNSASAGLQPRSTSDSAASLHRRLHGSSR